MPRRRASESPPDDALRPVSRRQEINPPAFLYAATTLFLAIGAVNSQNNLLFWAFGVAISGIVLSGILSGTPLMSIAARREEPELMRVGEPAAIRYRVWKTGRFIPAVALDVVELDDAWRARLPRGEQLGGVVPYLGVGTSALAVSAVTVENRGELRLNRFAIRTSFPLGLFRKVVVFEQPAVVAVAPRALPVARAVTAKLAGRNELSSSSSNKRGDSTEFYGLRAYTPGDPARTISWRASARLDTLVVRQTVRPRPPRIVVRLDTGDATTPDYLRERAIALAASTAESAIDGGCRVAVRVVGGPSTTLRSGRVHTGEILSMLATLESAPATGAADRSRPDGEALVVPYASSVGERQSAIVLAADETAGWLSGELSGGDVLPVPPAPPKAPVVIRAARWASTRLSDLFSLSRPEGSVA